MLDALDTYVTKLPESDRASFVEAVESARKEIARQAVLDTVNSLNSMIEHDPFSLNKLFCDMMACNPLLVHSPAEVTVIGDSHYIGILGIINGCLNSELKIVPVFTTGSAPYPIKQFSITEVNTDNG